MGSKSGWTFDDVPDQTGKTAIVTGKAWVKAINGRKAVIVGELRAEDRVCAEAEGLFIKPRA